MNALKAWAVDTGVRAVKTSAQALVALLGAHAVNVVNVPWGVDLGTAAFAGVVCVLQNVQSMPSLHESKAPELAPEPVAPAPASVDAPPSA
jgi:hypothetical protein